PGPPDQNGGGSPESQSILPTCLPDQGSIDCPGRPDRLGPPACRGRRPRLPDCSPGFVRPPGRSGRRPLRPVAGSGRLGGSGGWCSGFRAVSGGGPRSSKSSDRKSVVEGKRDEIGGRRVKVEG